MAGDNIPRFTFPAIVGRPVIRAEEAAIDEGDLKVRPPTSPCRVHVGVHVRMRRVCLRPYVRRARNPPLSRAHTGHYDWR